MTKWQVVDWTNDVQYGGKRFDSYEEARGYIALMAEEYADWNLKYQAECAAKKRIGWQYQDTFEEAKQGYIEDMYAVEVCHD